MAEHGKYRSMRLAKCSCMGGIVTDEFTPAHRLSFWGGEKYDITYGSGTVTFTCRACGGQLAIFYREPELEGGKAMADKSLIGSTVSARRRVAWVGYAVNSGTVEISQEAAEKTAVADILAKAISAWGKVTTCPLTEEWAEAFLCAVPWAAYRGFLRQSRYVLRGEVMREKHLNTRGFWFQDASVRGTVIDTVRCVTGERVLGSCNRYFMEFDPPYLSGQTHHALYVVELPPSETDPRSLWHYGDWRVLIHPGDVEVNDGKSSQTD